MMKFMTTTELYCLSGDFVRLKKSFNWFINDMRRMSNNNIERKVLYLRRLYSHHRRWQLFANKLKDYHNSYQQILDYLDSIDFLQYGTSIEYNHIVDLVEKEIDIHSMHNYYSDCIYNDIIIECVKNNIDGVKKYFIYQECTNDAIDDRYENYNLYNTCISVACFCKYTEMLSYLLTLDEYEYSVKDFCINDIYCYDGLSTNNLDEFSLNDIYIAAQNNNFDIVKILFDYCVDNNQLCWDAGKIHEFVTEVFRYACKYDNLYMIKYIFNALEQNGCDTVYYFDKFITVISCMNYSKKIAKYLLTKIKSYPHPIIMYDINNAHIPTVIYFLLSKSNIQFDFEHYKYKNNVKNFLCNIGYHSNTMNDIGPILFL